MRFASAGSRQRRAFGLRPVPGAFLTLTLGLTLAACGSKVGLQSQDAGTLGVATDPVTGLPTTSAAGSSVLGTQPGTTTTVVVTNPGSPTPTSAGQASEPAAARVPSNGPTANVKGRGWDAKHMYLGVVTIEDLHQYAGSLGLKLDPGSVVNDVNAIVRDVNAHGGVLGRQLVPIFHDNKTADVAANPDSVAQANCSYFTQDVKVFAVLNLTANINTRTFRECLRKAQMPLMAMDFVLADKQALQEAGPYIWTQHANLDQLALPWIQRLQAQSYFEGWDTRNSKTTRAAAKVGILGDDTPVGQRFIARLSAELKGAGIAVASTFTYSDSLASYGSEMSAAQLRFASAGVTHVLTVPPTTVASLVFMQTAEQQHYRPRYGMTTYLTPDELALNAPATQLVGAVGIGWNPGIDVNDGHDPGSNAERDCLATLARGGVKFTSGQRFAKAAGFTLCDAIHLEMAAIVTGNGLAPDALSRGITGLGPNFPVAVTFGNALAPGHPTLTGFSRDLRFVASCDCFAYVGSVHPI